MTDNDNHQNIKIQDSLDNLSNLKLRQSSLQKQRIQLIQTKQKFVGLLEKLQSSQTRQISLTQIKKLLEFNCQSQHLKIYLSILKTLKPNHNSTTKEHEILVISIMAQCFKENLIDVTDKQPNVLKTCFKVVEILLGFFNDSSATVQQACARVLLDLNQFCLIEGKIDKQQKLSVLFTPLISILKNGVDKASQATATVCINQLVKYWYSHQDKEYLDTAAKQVFQILLRLNSEYHEIFMACIILIEHKGLAFFENRLPNFLAKILPIINGTREAANNFNSYMCRVNVCKIIQKIGILLNAEQRDKLVDLNVFGSLQKAARNKIIQVQMAAGRAIKAWKGEPVSQERIQRRSNSQGKGLKSLEEMRDQKKRERSNSKQNTIKIQAELNYMKEDLQKMVKGGWGANNRAKNYVKRGTGVGGGHYGTTQYSTPPKNSKSHKEHLQELRQIIKKGAKQNKNLDKFQQVINKNIQNPQIPTSSNNNVSPNQIQKKKSNPTTSQKKVLDAYNQPQNDFQLVQDQGEQMVNIPTRSQLKKKGSGASSQYSRPQTPKQALKQKYTINPDDERQAQNFIMDSQQAKQLLQQQRLQNQYNNSRSPFANDKSQFAKNKNQQRNLNIDLNLPLNSSKEKAIQQQRKIARQTKLKDQKFIQRSSKIKQNLASLGPMISQAQLQDLMMQNNLSQVSDNLSNCLNQSDFNDAQNMNQIDDQDQLELVESKEEQSVDRRQFMKKGNESLKSDKNNTRKMEDSLNYTESRVTRLKESMKNPMNANQNNSNNRSQPNFTLNPNKNNYPSPTNESKRFQSIHDPQVQEQIQEDIVESCYEQSHPKDNILPLKTKIVNMKNSSPMPGKANENKSKTNKSSNIIIESNQQEQSKNYQQLIQNPPVRQNNYMDKKSNIMSAQKSASSGFGQNQNYSEAPEEEDEQPVETVTDKWIKILALVQRQEFNQAFEYAFQLDDPIYLLRLLIITKTPLSRLTAQSCSRLWDKFLQIYKHNFISILFIQMFTQANQLNLIKNSLTIQQMHDLLIKLYEVSGNTKGKLSFNAALLYNNIDEKLRPKSKKQ